MKDIVSILYHDIVGSFQRPLGRSLETIDIPQCLALALNRCYGTTVELLPPQEWSVDHGILRDHAHFVVSAPTNSGKTLIAVLRIFTGAIECGDRAVYVVPLKALAEEKAEEFREISRNIGIEQGPNIQISISTGDYQLTEDFLGSPPPENGQIIICTPERLETILRNNNNESWTQSIKTYVLDEFHLLGDKRRGTTFEILTTRILLNCPNSSIVALSATIGGVSNISSWLGHTGSKVRQLETAFRFPQLDRSIVMTSEKDIFVLRHAELSLKDPTRNLLIFVYTKRDAEHLANALSEHFRGSYNVASFHSGLFQRCRLTIMSQFRKGDIRILVTTTSLKMGINTPTTDVIVRDTVFHGSGRLRSTDVLQMLGRAGRRETPGSGYILLSSGEEACNYAEDFCKGTIEHVVGQLSGEQKRGIQSKKQEDSATDPFHAIFLSEIVRQCSVSLDELSSFLSHTFSFFHERVLMWNPQNSISVLEAGKLIYRIENSEHIYAPTKLGRTVSLSGLSPESGAMLGGFLRALMNLGEKQSKLGNEINFLKRLTSLDLLFLAASSFEVRKYWLGKPSKRQTDLDQEYVEQLSIEEKPILNLWRSEDSNDYSTHRLIASLRIPLDRNNLTSAEVVFRRLMHVAILLDKHSKGRTLDALAEEYTIYAGDLEGGLKYTVSWVLSCLTQICNPDKCYKLEALSLKIRELVENLRFGSNLGKLLSLKGVGTTTVLKLLGGGINSLHELKNCSTENLISFGITQSQVSTILQFIARQNR